MRKLFLISLSFLFAVEAFAQGAPSFWILERKVKSNKTIYKEVFLNDLERVDAFDGKYFKIVKGKSNEAIRFNDADEDLVSKAANVYHHLSKARNFWLASIKSPHSVIFKKLIIRLELTNVYDEQGHFAHDNRDPQYNNALSIPAGETPSWVPDDKKDKWNHEIWFRPMKRIDTSTLPDNLGANPLTASLESMEQPFINYTQNRFNQTLVEHMFYPTYAGNPFWEDVIRFAGTIALTKAIIEASKLTDSLFVEKYYYLDTAMVPEIIYHEYAHVVLSDHLKMTHSTPVIEGMADYFAAVMSKKKRIYAKIKGYSNSSSKNPRSKKPYSHWDEDNRNASADFVLSVLWDVRETLGETADQVIFESRKDLRTETASISRHLLQAILNACKTNCSRPRRDKLKLYETFSNRGF